ncbi:MAG: cytochrome c-type biogenesis protein CcmH [Xanthobacteraceae bacterium]|nr:cytochrome c-type biogenesis protein CcmH [Xanthobacteraceae bacterium]MBX3535548.1 cytochrome c-type biogenesis protein CcmH [Xanthobacteraceae bacterium]MBX3550169.1 cytochrome c-type biogenesis protein CcmH [Xanthobacteraceae bacterium]MCW5674160.1 cytochrome c-type biogenesis protein CcmH [Xanthobacteraceae bacterium]MCW5678028.1 cytochrome c-type biogenesis protein CcmH [Xanthobacteraceae bacterium]
MKRIALAIFFALALAAPVAAVQPDEVLGDTALEARARALSHTIRCMVCQNQSIDDSDAPLARDLRILIRERLTAGDTDTQIREFLVARYGQFVLLEPEKNAQNALLWLAPVFVLLAGVLVLFRFFRRRRAAELKPLSAAEKRRLKELS